MKTLGLVVVLGLVGCGGGDGRVDVDASGVADTGTGDSGSGTGDSGSGTGDSGSGTGDSGSGIDDVDADVVEPVAEQACGDLADNDADGFIDCDDVDDCGADEACASGSGALHAPCSVASDCAGPRQRCHSEADTGFPGGECSTWCTPGSDGCGPDAYCLGEEGRGYCVALCALGSGAPCRAAYDCAPYQVFDGVAIVDLALCVPGCDDDAQCSVRGACFDVEGWALSGLCVAPEDCTASGDEDQDGLVDCEDDDCAALAACDSAPVCAAATPLAVTDVDLVVTGDTTTGGTLLSGSCTGSHGGHEQVYSLIAGEAGQGGVLDIELGGGPDLGVYARTSCLDPGSELGCADNAYEDETEYTSFAIPGGVPVALVVDAIGGDDFGAFQMTLRFTADVCGDGTITGLESCDDENPSGEDGCSASCQPELDYFCAQAPTLGLAPVTGNTLTSASAYFQGSCTLPENDAKDDVYTFTAASEGRVTLTLTGTAGTTDLAIYVRSGCLPADSEIACVDDTRATGVESLTFGVVVGETYFVFVDGMLSDFDGGAYTLTMTVQ